MIVVVATMRAKAGREGEVEDILRELDAVTRAEAGCQLYDLHVREGDPTLFMFYERWESDAALDAHLTSPHVGDAFAKLGDLLESPPDILRYVRVE